jgi:hypothetical protein
VNRKIITSILCHLFLILISSSLAFSQEKDLEYNKYDQWNFRISPYAWLINVKGELLYPPEPPPETPPPPSPLPEEEPRYNIDLKFQDIRSSIKFASMISGKYRNKHIIVQINSSIVILEGSAITPLDLLLKNNTLKLWFYSGDIGIGYRVLKKPKLELNAFLGSKFLYTKVNVTTEILGVKTFEGERDVFWFNPTIGFSVFYRPINRIELAFYGDIGSRIYIDDLTYQFFAGANFMLAKWFYITPGYRFYYFALPSSDALFNGNIRGFLLKLGFQF